MATNLFDLSGKTALVTGSSRGLGLTIAGGLGEAGARVVLNGTTPSRLKVAVGRLSEGGITVCGRCFDVTDAVQVQRAVGAIEREVAPIDILVTVSYTHLRAHET